MGPHRFRVRLDGCAGGHDGLVQLYLPDESNAEASVGLGVIRLEADGLPPGIGCLAEPAVPLQRRSEVAMSSKVVRLQASGIPVDGKGLVQLSLRREGVAE